MKKILITIIVSLIIISAGLVVYFNFFNNKILEQDILSDTYNQSNINIPIQDNNIMNLKDESENQNIVEPESKITTSYMCDDQVKIITTQDLSSLPPQISYIRLNDGVQVAYYGDFGAYIVPEYFSIDRAQIEQGYTFNKENFCKYLKK